MNHAGILRTNPLDARNLRNVDVPIRDKVVAWLIQQGVSTVLLFAITYGVYAKTEVILGRFESGYQRNAQELQRAAQSYEKTIEQAIMQWKEDRRILIEVLRKDHADLKIPQSMINPVPSESLGAN